MDPGSGGGAGGNTVTITGTGFLDATKVKFGDVNAISFSVVDNTKIQAVVPEGTVGKTVTWDCGYVAPTPRMQYTASSFARPLTLLFRLFLQPRDEIHPPHGLFPRYAGLHTRTPDLFRRFVYEPLFLGVAWLASKLHRLQEGRIQIYVLYIALTILVLLIWKLG